MFRTTPTIAKSSITRTRSTCKSDEQRAQKIVFGQEKKEFPTQKYMIYQHQQYRPIFGWGKSEKEDWMDGLGEKVLCKEEDF